MSAESGHKLIINTVPRRRIGGRYQGRQRPHLAGDSIDASDLDKLLAPDTDPTDPNSVVTVEYIEEIVGSSSRIHTRVLTAADVANRFITLPSSPKSSDRVILSINQAPGQTPILDFITQGDKLDWNGRLIDGIVEAGDVMQVIYN